MDHSNWWKTECGVDMIRWESNISEGSISFSSPWNDFWLQGLSSTIIRVLVWRMMFCNLSIMYDVLQFEHHVWNHLSKHGMDIIAYLRSKAIDVVRNHARFSADIKTTKKSADFFYERFDKHDQSNNSTAKCSWLTLLKRNSQSLWRGKWRMRTVLLWFDWSWFSWSLLLLLIVGTFIKTKSKQQPLWISGLCAMIMRIGDLSWREVVNMTILFLVWWWRTF